jgi:hypothetical protein
MKIYFNELEKFKFYVKLAAIKNSGEVSRILLAEPACAKLNSSIFQFSTHRKIIRYLFYEISIQSAIRYFNVTNTETMKHSARGKLVS